jgi:peptide/nickel transport system ATP-binding protein
LRVKDLRVHFFLDEGLVRAVDGVSFDVEPGRVVGIVGESGCGKSVTMKAILQIVEPPGRIVGGQILFQKDSQPPVDLALLSPRGAELRAIRGAEIALIPQEPWPRSAPCTRSASRSSRRCSCTSASGGRRPAPVAERGARDDGRSLPQRRASRCPTSASTPTRGSCRGGLRQRAMIAMALSCRPRS